jgi:hypothetical protein
VSDDGTIRVAGHEYRLEGKLSAMEQFHITRRLGPAIVLCGLSFKAMMDGAAVPVSHWVTVAGPVMEVVSRMSDEDVEYVIMTSLRVCRRQSSGTWAPVVTPDGRQLMFSDTDQADLIHLTLAVLRANLENFFRGLDDGQSTGGGSAPSPAPTSTRSS